MRRLKYWKAGTVCAPVPSKSKVLEATLYPPVVNVASGSKMFATRTVSAASVTVPAPRLPANVRL